MSEFGHSNMFNRKPQQLTGKKLTTNGEQCCEPVDSTVSDFEYNEETGILTITLNTGETFPVDLSTLALVDGNIDSVTYDSGTGDLTITSTVGGPYVVNIPYYAPYTVGNTLFVYSNGNSGTALPNRPDLPYAFPWDAVAAASAGDTVVVYPGTYTLDAGNDNGSRRIVKDEVVLHMMPGAIIDIESTSSSDVFQSPGDGTYTIKGQGKIVYKRSGFINTSMFNGDVYDFEFNEFECSGTNCHILASTFDSYSLTINKHTSYGSFFYAVCSTTSNYLNYKCNLCYGGVDTTFTYGILIEGSAKVVNVDVNAVLLVHNDGSDFFIYNNPYEDSTANIKINMKAVYDGVSNVYGRVASIYDGADGAVLNMDLKFHSYGRVLKSSWTGGKAYIKAVGYVGDHFPGDSDFLLDANRGAMTLELDTVHDGGGNTNGILTAIAPNINISKTYITGKIKVLGNTVEPIRFGDPAYTPDPTYYASLSNLKIYAENGTYINEPLAAAESTYLNVDNVQSNLLFNYGTPLNITAQGETFVYLPTLLL